MDNGFDEKKWVEEELANFLRARDTNSVVKQLFVPDSSLDQFRQFHLTWDDKAYHRAVSFIANKRGELTALCDPLEEMIFNRRGGAVTLTKQYTKDLEETWYRAVQPEQRQARCNKFMGKVLEFHAASFSEQHYGWQVEEMEAFQKDSVPLPDILAKQKGANTIAIACKTLCQSPEIFGLTVQAAENNGVYRGWISVYSPIDYLLFRICEGAWSLAQFSDRFRVVMVPLLHAANFKLQLDDNWINFSRLRFLDNDNQMFQFWQTRKEARQKAEVTLAQMSQCVDGIVICEIGDGYKFSVCKEHWYRETV